MSKPPAVSVVIPVYNKREQIEPTLQSVFDQTYRDFEIVVVDDGSTDGSIDILQSFGDQIRLKLQKNAGPSKARNTGIEIATGNYVAFLDADDRWKPNKLEIQMQFLTSNPDLVWVASNYINCDENGKAIGPAHEGLEGDWTLFENWFKANTGRYMILTSGVVVRRDMFDNVGVFDEEIPAGQDIDLWMRIARASPRYGYCNLPMFDYLQLPGSVSKASFKKFESNTRIIEKHIEICTAANDPAYSEYLRSYTENVVKSTISYGIPTLSKRILDASPPGWNSSKLKIYRIISKLPASWQRLIAKIYRARHAIS